MKLSVFEKILRVAVKMGASDIHFKVGVQPMLRINGNLLAIKNLPEISGADINQVSSLILSEENRERFNKRERNEIDFSLKYKNFGRFRVNLFRGHGGVRIVMRVISSRIPSIQDLMLPPIVADLANSSRGLILVTGTTGSGKSTTLAAMINYINNNYTRHIVTIEDPIEYEIVDKKSLISQREIGTDCSTFSEALRAAMRQDPNIILVGEMRDYETICAAIAAAETGHLVLSTLHTIDATETINRVMSTVPVTHMQQMRHQLASVMKAIISQRLVVRADGKSRVPAVEILINNQRIAELIESPERTKEIHDAIAESNISYGMQTFDQSLMKLYKEGYITLKEAMRYCTDQTMFSLRMKGVRSDKDRWGGFEGKDGDDDVVDFAEVDVEMEDR